MAKSLHFLLNSIGLPIASNHFNPLISGLSSDSRNIKRGDLFLGLPGEKCDGGNYWSQALSNGAAAALISEEAEKLHPPSPHDPIVVVPKPVAYWLGELAAVFWDQPSQNMSLIGVTGTNGKTTTAHLIEHLSMSLGTPTALFGTLCNRWPMHSVKSTHTTAFTDSLQAQLSQAIKAGAKLAAMEVSSHALAQKRVAGCQFSGAIFTNLTQDHLDYHSSMEEYFAAKRLLFKQPLLMSGKNRAVVNVDDTWGAVLAKELGDVCWRSSLKETNGKSSPAELTINQVEFSSRGLKGILKSPVGEGAFNLPLLGKFNLMNVLQAVGALLQQGYPLEPTLSAISNFSGVPGRMQKVKVKDLAEDNLPTVLIDYAHTPDGLKNALSAAKPFTSGNLICVFGCGGDRDCGKRPLMGEIAAAIANLVIVTSDNPRTEDPLSILKDIIEGIPDGNSHVIVETNRELAIKTAILKASNKDVILIAGKGHEDYQIIGEKKIRFCDLEEAKKALIIKSNKEF